MIGAHVFMRVRERRLDQFVGALPAPVLVVGWAAMLVALVLAQGGGNAFIYFQF